MIIGYHDLLNHVCSSIGANLVDRLIIIKLTIMLLGRFLKCKKMLLLQMSQLPYYKALHNPWCHLFLVMSGKSS